MDSKHAKRKREEKKNEQDMINLLKICCFPSRSADWSSEFES